MKNGQRPYFRPSLEACRGGGAGGGSGAGVSDGISGRDLSPDDQTECCSEELATLIRRCWNEDPGDRPDVQAIKSHIRKINKCGAST